MNGKQLLARAIALLLALCLLPLSSLAESGGPVDSDAVVYEAALSLLTSSSLTDREKLEDIRQQFEQAGSYQLGVEYLTYTEALFLLLGDDLNGYDDAYDALDRLSRQDKYLDDYRQHPSLPPLGDLLLYVEARKKERFGYREEALIIFDRLTVLDAVQRAGDLSRAIKSGKYDEAAGFLTANTHESLAKAASLLTELGSYRDSPQKLEECREKIAALGPPPPPASLTAEVMSGAVILRWPAAEGAEGYQIYRRDMAKDKEVLLGKLEETWYADADAEAGHTYGYRVASVTGSRVSTASAIAEAVIPAPAPTSVPAVKVPIYYKSSTGTLLRTDHATCLVGNTTYYANDAFMPAGYELTGNRSVTITVYANGTALPANVTFTYRKLPTPTPVPTPKPVRVGTTVTFGKYEQDNNTYNGKEPIEWRVLAVENRRALLISEKNLDGKPYHGEYETVTWENCTLREWLNGDFFHIAFSTAEQKTILTTTLSNKDNPEYGTDGGRDTSDMVFLLSIEEAERYFRDNNARRAQNTAFARAQGALDNNGFGRWWLRSPGTATGHAADVNNCGSIHEYGIGVNNGSSTVRPAFWADLSSEIIQSVI